MRRRAGRADGDDVEDVRPPVTGTLMLKGPVAATAETTVVAELASVFVAAT